MPASPQSGGTPGRQSKLPKFKSAYNRVILDKAVTLAQSMDVLQTSLRDDDDRSPSPDKKKEPFVATTPQAPHLHESKRRPATPEPDTLVTAAQSEDFMKRGLRNEKELATLPPAEIKRTEDGKIVAEAPTFHSSHRPNSEEKSLPEGPSAAQSEDFMKKGLRNESDVSAPSPQNIKRTDDGKIVAEAPTFRSSHRPHNENESFPDEPSAAQSNVFMQNALRNEKAVFAPPAQNVKRTPDGKIVAEAPKFHTTNRHNGYGDKGSANTTLASNIPLAQSDDILRKGLRSGDDHPPSQRPSDGVTRPESPKFSEMHKRALPKSTDEREKEMMEYIRANPFKAKDPARPRDDSDASEGTGMSSKTPTEIKPFRLRSEERAQHNMRTIEVPPSKESVDLVECNNKFRALKMPPVTAPKIQPKNTTTPKERVEKANKKSTQEKKTFRARPIPLSTYLAPERPAGSTRGSSVKGGSLDNISVTTSSINHPSNRGGGSVISSIFEDVSVTSPHHGDSRIAPSSPVVYFTRPASPDNSQVTKETFRQRAEALQREKEAHQKKLQREKHKEAMEKARSAPLPEIKPFNLASVDRHDLRMKQLAKQRKLEDQLQKQQARFRARPLPASIHAPAMPSSQKLGEPAVPSPVLGNRVVRVPTSAPVSFPSRRTVASKNRGDGSQLLDDSFRKEFSSTKDDDDSSDHGSPLFTPRSLGSDFSPRNIGKNGTAESLCMPGTIGEQASPFPTSFVFALICLVRVLNTFLVQSYFDPDEFWQTMEPAYCEVFSTEQTCPGFTWEWKRRPPDSLGFEPYSVTNFVERSMWGPARTYLSVLPTYFYFLAIQFLGIDSHWTVSRGPVFLSSIIVAAPVDMAVWYSAHWLPQPKGLQSRYILPAWCLFCSLASWFNGYSLVRTFANSQETLFLMWAIAFVSPELLANEDRKWYYLRASIAFLLGGLSTTIRFTSLAAFVPMGIILALRQNRTLLKVLYLFIPCALFGLLGLLLGMVVDYIFFGFWTVPFLANFHFNVVLDYAGLFGTHPFHWYATAGLPAVTGVLLPFLLWDFASLVMGRQRSYGQRNLWIITVSYIFIMSFNSHKEFRYIHPVLPIGCLLAGQKVRSLFVGETPIRWSIRTSALCSVFVVANLIAVMYLGLFHQSGPIIVNRRIVSYSQLRQSFDRKKLSFNIHYLTGACHSAPLHSYLHAPPLSFKTWALDCSPQCRADPDALCETELFSIDPAGFIAESYIHCNGTLSQSTGRCTMHPRAIPDYIVTFSSYAYLIEDQLQQLGFTETDRFPQHLNGARIGEFIFGEDYTMDQFRKYKLTEGVSVSMEEVVLFVRFDLADALRLDQETELSPAARDNGIASDAREEVDENTLGSQSAHFEEIIKDKNAEIQILRDQVNELEQGQRKDSSRGAQEELESTNTALRKEIERLQKEDSRGQRTEPSDSEERLHLNDVEKQLASSRERLLAYEENAAATRTESREIQEELRLLRSQVALSEKELSDMKQASSALEGRNKEIQNALREADDHVATLQNQVAQHEKSSSDADEEAKLLQSKVAALEQELVTSKQEASSFEDRNRETNKALADAQKLIETLTGQGSSSLEETLSQSQESLNEARDKIESLTNQLVEQGHSFAKLELELNGTREDLDRLKSEGLRKEQELAGAKQASSYLEDEIQRYRDALSNARELIGVLRKQMVKKEENFSAALKISTPKQPSSDHRQACQVLDKRSDKYQRDACEAQERIGSLKDQAYEASQKALSNAREIMESFTEHVFEGIQLNEAEKDVGTPGSKTDAVGSKEPFSAGSAEQPHDA